jgi:seryl-tRNA synthetase
MHDIRTIRVNPVDFDNALARRGYPPMSKSILELYIRYNVIQSRIQKLLERRNQITKLVGVSKKNNQNVDHLLHEMASLKTDLAQFKDIELTAYNEYYTALLGIPNLPQNEIPDGLDERYNVEIKKWGNPNNYIDAKQHFELGEFLGHMDFHSAAKMSGARFVILKSGLAKLERALSQFMLDLHTREHGYTEISPPLLVHGDSLVGTGQLPKFSDDLFKIQSTNYYLIPTAEVPLTNIVSDLILDLDQLPIRFVASTPCFRAEAGSAGKDTRGMIRQHQFSKVELVSITTPEQSVLEHERMTRCAEKVLEQLELPYRTVLLCAGDMGFSASKTYDIEVWLPGQKTYREISSCSNCGDFQARRMKTRYKSKDSKQNQFVHTLNGSGVAVGRCLVAVLENYQQEDGSIIVPKVLHPYMGGLERIIPS